MYFIADSANKPSRKIYRAPLRVVVMISRAKPKAEGGVLDRALVRVQVLRTSQELGSPVISK